MADSVSSRLPALVRKRDSRLVPFETDKISASLYAASEELGQPSAFLARELTDGVLHFLAAEVGAEPPTTTQLAEVIAKVVRELGQPELAHVYAQRRRIDQHAGQVTHDKPVRSEGVLHFSVQEGPPAVVRQCLRAYSLQAVFGRDVAAAHEEGLLKLTGLEHPQELARKVMEPRSGLEGWLPLLGTPARTLVFDSPEYALTEAEAGPWLHSLADFCATTERSAILNLHMATPPPWATSGENGPLFGTGAAPSPDRSRAVADMLATPLPGKPVTAHWHLSDADFAAGGLASLENLAMQGRALSFTFDRSRRHLGLAPGMARKHPGVLLDVHLDLLRFLRMIGVDHDARLFLEKLPSLARMAVRAGIQKRNFLRGRANHPELVRGFVLERASLVVVPAGLAAVVEELLRENISGSVFSLDLAKQIVSILHDTLQSEGVTSNLDIVVDGPAGELPGFTKPIGVKEVEAAGALHKITGFGSVPLQEGNAQSRASMLQHVWKKTDVVRVDVA